MKKNTLYIIYVLSMCLGTADIPSVNIRSLSDLVQLSVILKDVHKKAKTTTVCLDLGDGASGSGVVVSSSGLIMSAAHVTQEVDKELKVIFEDGTEYSAVGLGLDTSSDASLAQITLPEGAAPLPFVETSTDLQIGQYVFALGHSGGFDIERGSVLRLGRITHLEEDSMRTDCPLIGGDSGGPLFDLSGRLIAIHSRVGAVTNSNTHIPVKVYQHQWESLKSGKLMGDGTFAHAGINFLGMHILEKDGEFHVLSVAEKTRASEAGVLAGDILLKLNGKKIDSGLALLKVLKSLDIRPEGIDLSLTFLRAGEAREVNFIFND